MALRRKRPWRHATAVHREQRRPAADRNDIWSMDFVADQLADGRRFRTLTVLDLFTRQCLEIAVGRSLTGQDVVRALERLRFDRGLPQRIYCDNGTEFVSAAMDLWAYTNGHAGRSIGSCTKLRNLLSIIGLASRRRFFKPASSRNRLHEKYLQDPQVLAGRILRGPRPALSEQVFVRAESKGEVAERLKAAVC